MQRFSAGALAVLLMTSPSRAHAANGSEWINLYINTQGGCAGFDDKRHYLDAPYPGYIFGKLADQWSSDDIGAMRTEVLRCEEDIKKISNSPPFIKEVINAGDTIISEVPKRVLVARQARAKLEGERTSRMAAESIASSKEIRDQEAKEAEDSRLSAVKDQADAAALLKDSKARSQVIIAAAHARRDAAISRQEVAAMEAEAKAAQAEADQAERAAAEVQQLGKPSIGQGTAFDNAAEQTLIRRMQTKWRAKTGETADEIIRKVKNEAHFVPVSWSGDLTDGRSIVSLSWKKNASDSDDDTYALSWEQKGDGSFETIGGFSEVDLGSDAFATSLIQEDVGNESLDANSRFTLEASHYSFVNFPKSNLSHALASNACRLENPAYVVYAPSTGEKTSKDTFFVSLTVNCSKPGDKFFTHHGYVQFRSFKGSSEWTPVSFLAQRLLQGRALDEGLSAQEQQTMMLVRNHVPVDQSDDVIRFIEMRRSSPNDISDEASILRNVDLIKKIGSEHTSATPSELAAFLRGAGPMAHTLSDEGIRNMAVLF